MDARVVVFGGEKGGVGKTMLAIHLVVWLLARGRRALLCDVDTQGSAARWARGRRLFELTPLVPWSMVSTESGVYASLDAARRQHDVIVVDVGGADSAEFHEALALCDVLLCPTTPGDCDLGTLELVNELVQAARASGKALRAHVVLNLCANDGGAEEREARADLLPFKELSVAKSTLAFRKGFRTAYRRRLTIGESAETTPRWEHQRRYGEGAREVEALFEELFA